MCAVAVAVSPPFKSFGRFSFFSNGGIVELSCPSPQLYTYTVLGLCGCFVRSVDCSDMRMNANAVAAWLCSEGI